jgi:hypothetical protein
MKGPGGHNIIKTVAAPPSGGIPSPAPGVSLFDDWCPLANLFENREANIAWAEGHYVHSPALSLAEAAARVPANWRPIV